MTIILDLILRAVMNCFNRRIDKIGLIKKQEHKRMGSCFSYLTHVSHQNHRVEAVLPIGVIKTILCHNPVVRGFMRSQRNRSECDPVLDRNSISSEFSTR